jgi:hypothetical protein
LSTGIGGCSSSPGPDAARIPVFRITVTPMETGNGNSPSHTGRLRATRRPDNSAAIANTQFCPWSGIAPSFLMSMTFAQMLGVGREGKPVPTFRIMRQQGFGFHSLGCLCDLR